MPIRRNVAGFPPYC